MTTNAKTNDAIEKPIKMKNVAEIPMASTRIGKRNPIMNARNKLNAFPMGAMTFLALGVKSSPSKTC